MVNFISNLFDKVINSTLSFYEFFILFMLLSISWAVREGWQFYSHKKKPNQSDLEAYNRFKNIFTQKLIDFLRVGPFGDYFRGEIFDPLFSAIYNERFSNPDYIFFNKKLEKKREKVIEALDKFSNVYATEIFVSEFDNKLFCVPKRNERFDPGQQKYIAIILKLNKLARELVSKLDDMEIECKKHFDKKLNS